MTRTTKDTRGTIIPFRRPSPFKKIRTAPKQCAAANAAADMMTLHALMLGVAINAGIRVLGNATRR